MEALKKIVIAGGNGFLGQLLVTHFLAKNYQVISLNRKQSTTKGNLKLVQWDGRHLGDWKKELEGCEVLINLVGRSVDCRYNQKNRNEILMSRLNSTQALGEAIQELEKPPKLWINSSSATIYRHSLDKAMNEKNGEIGNGFSVDVCQQWEAMAKKYKSSQSRLVLLRTAMVMGKSGGVFPVLSKLVKQLLGGKQGKGNQYVSWIHEVDFIQSIDWIIDHEDLEGAINCAAPEPLPNHRFMSLLRRQLKIPIGLNAPKFLLELGAIFLRTETELVLKSRRVVPSALLASGYQFSYPKAELALEELTN